MARLRDRAIALRRGLGTQIRQIGQRELQIGKRTPNSKAETLCDALYMVVSGVPDRCDDHAFNITELALDLLRSVRKMHNPADEKVALHLRVGSSPVYRAVLQIA